MKMSKQNAEFHVTDSTDDIWSGDYYYVIRNGEMRLHYGENVIRYTDQLISAGIIDDDTLDSLIGVGAVEMIDNPWFEVVSHKFPDDDGEVFHTLDDAVERAQYLDRKEWERGHE